MARLESLHIIAKQKFLMSLSGMWPQSNPSFFYKCRNIFALSTCTIATIMMLMEMIHVRDDFDAFSTVLSLFITPFVYLIKHFIFMWKGKLFLRALERMQNPVFNKYPDYLNKYIKQEVKVSIRLANAYQSCCAIVISLYSCKPFVSKTYELPVSFSVFELGNWKYLVHFLQSSCLLSAAWNNSGLDLIAVAIMSIGSANFDILYHKIKNVRDWVGLTYQRIDMNKNGILKNEEINDAIDEQVNAALKECVQYHLELLEFLEDMKVIFSFAFLAQYLNSVVVICNTGFQMVHTSPKSIQFVIMVMYFLTMMVQLALYCLFGNELMLKSLQIKDACYMSSWTACGHSVRKSLLIIMERTKRPFYLTAGKFANLSLEAYTSIIRAAYSYFALMQRLYNDNEYQ